MQEIKSGTYSSKSQDDKAKFTRSRQGCLSELNDAWLSLDGAECCSRFQTVESSAKSAMRYALLLHLAGSQPHGDFFKAHPTCGRCERLRRQCVWPSKKVRLACRQRRVLQYQANAECRLHRSIRRICSKLEPKAMEGFTTPASALMVHLARTIASMPTPSPRWCDPVVRRIFKILAASDDPSLLYHPNRQKVITCLL